jgi:hypothetical protein
VQSGSSARITPTPSLAGSKPTVLRRFATDAFKAPYTTDVVYVPTYFSSACGTTAARTQNRVYALRATDGVALWAFNDDFNHEVDIVTRGLEIDLREDALYFGSERLGSSNQSSLWKISALDGSLIWSTNLGRLHTAPYLRGERLYVGTLFGEVKALLASDGSELWSVATGALSDHVIGSRRNSRGVLGPKQPARYRDPNLRSNIVAPQADQLGEIGNDARSAWASSTASPRPVATPCGTVPAHHRVGSHDHDVSAPLGPQLGQP